MKTGKWHSVAATLSILCMNHEALANSYTIIDLGNFRYPIAINNGGELAGNSGDPGVKGLRYLDGTWHQLAPQSVAFGINDEGFIVGGRRRIPAAEIWKPHGASKVIAPPQEGQLPLARAINSKNVVVGSYVLDATHCFIKVPHERSVDMGSLSQGGDCLPAAINEAGQVTGESITSNDDFHAFLWQDGKMTDLGVVAGTLSSAGLAINGSGVVVGTAQVDAFDTTAILWDGSMSELAPFSPYMSSAATAINGSGAVVGWALKRGSNEQSAARFSGGEVVLLNDEVVDLGDWNLTETTGINDAGIIVGSGIRKTSGEIHGYELIPQ